MNTYMRRSWFLAAVVALALSIGVAAGFGQAAPVELKAPDPTGLPIIGTWRINLDKSSPRLRQMRDPS